MAKKVKEPSVSKQEKRYWLDEPRNVSKVAYALYGICALLLLIDPLIHKHGPFAIEHWFGFYGFLWFRRKRRIGYFRQRNIAPDRDATRRLLRRLSGV